MALVNDVLALILHKLSLTELHEWAELSADNYVLVRQELRSRHRRMLSRFFANVPGILDLLQSRSSVISGSFALNYLTGEKNWEAADIDIYVPYHEFQEVRDYIIEFEGYRQDPEDMLRHARRLAKFHSRTLSDILANCKFS